MTQPNRERVEAAIQAALDMDEVLPRHVAEAALAAADAVPAEPGGGQMGELPICIITGRIAGDPQACGDCDPCGAANKVPDPVKRLIAEKEDWANRYSDAMQRLDEFKAQP